MTTGQIIKQARTKAGMTQAQLAEKLNIPYQSISQWERDVRNPRYDTLVKIANALGQDYTDLFNGPLRGFGSPSDYPQLEASEDALNNWLDEINSKLKSADSSKNEQSRKELEFIRDTINQMIYDRESLQQLKKKEEKRQERLRERLKWIISTLDNLNYEGIDAIFTYMSSLVKVSKYFRDSTQQTEQKVISVGPYELLLFQYEQALNQFAEIRNLPYDRETRGQIMDYQKNTWPDIIQRLMEPQINNFFYYESDEAEERAMIEASDDLDRVHSQGSLDKFLGLGPADFDDYEGPL